MKTQRAIQPSPTALVRQVEDFLRLLGDECKTCFQRRCSECYSPRAKILADELRTRRLARRAAAERSLTDEERDAIDFVRARAPKLVRAHGLPGARNAYKSLEEKEEMFERLCAKGLLVMTVLPDRNGKRDKYFALPPKE